MKNFFCFIICLSVFFTILQTTHAQTIDSNSIRVETGTDYTIGFEANTSVAGQFIQLDTGENFTNCYLPKSPTSGNVTNGVIYPWYEEVQYMNICATDDILRQIPQFTPSPVPKTTLVPTKAAGKPLQKKPDKTTLTTGTVWIDYNNNHIMDCNSKSRCDKALSKVNVWTIATYSAFRPCEGITSLTLNAKTDSNGVYTMEIPQRFTRDGKGGSVCYTYPHRLAIGQTPKGFREIRGTQNSANEMYEIRLIPTSN